jgi:hypothetical protein
MHLASLQLLGGPPPQKSMLYMRDRPTAHIRSGSNCILQASDLQGHNICLHGYDGQPSIKPCLSLCFLDKHSSCLSLAPDCKYYTHLVSFYHAQPFICRCGSWVRLVLLCRFVSPVRRYHCGQRWQIFNSCSGVEGYKQASASSSATKLCANPRYVSATSSLYTRVLILLKPSSPEPISKVRGSPPVWTLLTIP